jgi:GNAT superfamily N-acetyltransferase
MEFRIEISDRHGRDPEVVGSPTAYDLYCLENCAAEYAGSCVVYDEEEPTLGTSFDHYEKRGLATINSLFIENEYRNRGLGLYLLQWVMSHLYNHKDMRYVELDDASDYYGRSDCIYRRAGFTYDRDDNHMMANLRHCVMA